MSGKKGKKPQGFRKIFKLFLVFLKIGAFTFGGGYAMIPLMQREVVEKHKYISDDDILDIIAIAESTPGPIAINASTFIGYKIAGFPGAFFSTVAVVLPSFAIILLVSFLLDSFGSITAVRYAFFGIRAGVLALIVKALVSMYKQCPKYPLAHVIFAVAFIAVAVFDANALFVIIFCAVLGLVTSLVNGKKAKK